MDPPRLNVILVVCILLTIDVSAPDGNAYCTVPTPKSGDPPLPSMDYSYSAQISVKYFDLKWKSFIREFYEKDKYLASYDELNGVQFIVYEDFKKKKEMILRDEKCKIYDSEPNKYIQYGTLQVRFQFKDKWKYEKETTIRGVKVRSWSTCITEPDHANYTINFYFTKDNIPFRFETKGFWGGIDRHRSRYDRTFDYFLFTKGSPPSSVFKVPPGTFCENITYSVTPPVVTSAIFNMQEVDPRTKTVINHIVLYDRENKVSEMDDGKRRHIHDYNRGIQFDIDKATGECTRHALNRFAGNDKIGDTNDILHMESLKHILFADGNFTYNGVHKARGIPCDVYTRVSYTAEKQGLSTIELYFATTQVRVTSKEGSVSASVQQPVRILVSRNNKKYDSVIKRQLDIYDFRPQKKFFGRFFVDSCFDGQTTITFKMIFKSEEDVLNKVDTREWILDFMGKVENIICHSLGISYLQLDIFSNVFKAGKIELKCALYGPENELTRFRVVHNKKIIIKIQPKDFLTYKNLSNTPTICSDYCAMDDDRPRPFNSDSYCYSFAFDRETKDCTFYFTPIDDKNKTDHNLYYSYTMDFYARMEPYSIRRVSLEQSWYTLQKLVQSGSINVTDSEGNFIKAAYVTRLNKATEDDDHKALTTDDNPLSHFEDISNTGVLSASPVEVISNIYFYACARHCLNALKYNCEAFQVIPRETSCSFYDSNAFRKLKDQETSKMMYIRLYLSNFDEIPGRSMLSSDRDSVYTDVTGPNACAELCSKEEEFYCQSFEICGDTCLLGRKHIYNTPPSHVKERYDCVHYSRNYIQDYMKQKNKKALRDSKVVEIGNIGVKKCASLCSTSSNYNCDMFEFCDSDSICRLTTESVKNSDSLSYKRSGVCDLYSRKHGRHRFVYSYYKLTSTINDGRHSPGAMGGIAIGMLVVGMFLILVVALGILKLRSSGDNYDISVGFSKQLTDGE